MPNKRGELEGNRILSEKTVEMMFTSQTGNLPVGSAESQDPVLTNDIGKGLVLRPSLALGYFCTAGQNTGAIPFCLLGRTPTHIG